MPDGHSAEGLFGYFPTYMLGDVFAVQLFAAAQCDLGDLDACMSAGDLRPLLTWLRERIHRHGSRHPASELVARARRARAF